MSKTNFDRFLEEQLCGPAFVERFKAAGEAWDAALQTTGSSEEGNSQKEEGMASTLPNS